MILFVGDRPSKRTDPMKPFKGAACEKRLMEWIDTVAPDTDYILYNKDDKGLHIAAILNIVVALGNNASEHLSSMDIHHFKLPHPSGRNRQINNKEFINKKLEECKNWLKLQNS